MKSDMLHNNHMREKKRILDNLKLIFGEISHSWHKTKDTRQIKTMISAELSSNNILPHIALIKSDYDQNPVQLNMFSKL